MERIAEALGMAFKTISRDVLRLPQNPNAPKAGAPEAANANRPPSRKSMSASSPWPTPAAWPLKQPI
jgi:hypothetical protein